MVGAGGVQDAGDLLNLLVGIVSPRRTGVFRDSPEDGQERERDDGLLVDDVELVADGCDTQAGAGGQNSGLGEGAASGHGDGLQDGLSLLLGVLLGQIGVEAGLGGDGGQGAERERWAETGGACSG